MGGDDAGGGGEGEEVAQGGPRAGECALLSVHEVGDGSVLTDALGGTCELVEALSEELPGGCKLLARGGEHLSDLFTGWQAASGGVGIVDVLLEVEEDGGARHDRAKLFLDERDCRLLADVLQLAVDLGVDSVSCRCWRVVAGTGGEGGCTRVGICCAVRAEQDT